MKGPQGFKVDYTLKDLAGWTNNGLAKLASSLGLDTGEKDLLDEYKSCMEKGLVEGPHDFLKYSLNDVRLLKSIVEGQVRLINWVCKDVLEINKVFTQDTIPMTQGSVVSDIFSSYLRGLLKGSSRYGAYRKDPEYRLTLAFSKLSLLDPAHQFYKKNLELHTSLFHKNGVDFSKDSEILCKEESEQLDRRQLMKNYKTMYKHHVYSHSSIQYLLDYHSNSTAVFNALVSGGRTINERYWEKSRSFCADIDLSSCYGSALRDFDYPLGLPEIYATGSNQKKMLLGDFLKKYESRLVPNLYKIVISGELYFEQDLIFSKLTSESQIKKNFFSEETKFNSSFTYDHPQSKRILFF